MRKVIYCLLFIMAFAQNSFAIDRNLMLVQNTADKSGMTLEGLGFDTKNTQPADDQSVMNERARKLSRHQKLGLLTLALATATVATAKEGEPAPENHEHLGMITAASYFTTAYYSLTAPETKASEAKSKGWNMNVHRTMAFIHFPAMLLLPFAGKQASDDFEAGNKPSGLGKHKKNLANLAVGSMAIAAISVAIDF